MVSTVFVVEGKTDKALLQSYIKSYIVITDGNNVSRETLKHLQALENHHNIVIITDPDLAGNEINAKIAASLQQPTMIKFTKADMMHSKKIGLAEIKREVLRKKLKGSEYKTKRITTVPYYEFWAFYQKELINDARLIAFTNYFSLYKTSAKILHTQLEYLGITINDIKNWNKT